ncbi:MAG: histidinol-phosphatase [Oscillospiraceae bacterium]|nr:histidinol-phosphatase [Oscillospiraceae bacterium]
MNNYHTHTRYCDGADTPEELIQEALRLGCSELGFSGHSHLEEDTGSMSDSGTLIYCAEIRRLAERYRGLITIRLGIEQDIFSEIDRGLFDYVIGAVHYVEKDGIRRAVDESRESFLETVNTLYNGDFYALSEDYFALVSQLWERTHCDIIAHFDLVTKYNEGDCLFRTDHPRYLAAAESALRALLSSPATLEINTGAMARGWRSEPYPQQRWIDMWKTAGGRLILSSDCHDKRNLLYGFDQEKSRL